MTTVCIVGSREKGFLTQKVKKINTMAIQSHLLSCFASTSPFDVHESKLSMVQFNAWAQFCDLYCIAITSTMLDS